MAAVQSWVALEERIVHDYKAQRTVPVKPAAPPAQQPVQEKAPIFETLSVQTVTSAPVALPPLKKPSSDGKRSFFRLGTAVLSLGWMAAGLFAFFYAGEMSLRQELTLKLAESQGENRQLLRTVSTVKAVVSGQREELQKLNTQVQTLSGELGAAQSKAAAYTAMEKSYRDELLRVTAQYEEQVESMRKIVSVRDELVKSLQNHVQAIDKLVTEGGLATAFSAALKAMEEQKKTAPAAPQRPEGNVVMVNRPYQFIVVNLGENQGARAGGLIDIVQDGRPLAQGRLERVYPTMAAVTVLTERALEEIKEGDSVFLASH